MSFVSFGNFLIAILACASYALQLSALYSKEWLVTKTTSCGLFKCCNLELTACASTGKWSRVGKAVIIRLGVPCENDLKT